MDHHGSSWIDNLGANLNSLNTFIFHLEFLFHHL